MERRKTDRVELTHDIVLDNDLSARNLSETGIQIQSARALKIGRELKVQLDLGTERISVIGTVRWCSAELADNLDSAGFICGLEFHYQNSGDQAAVLRYLDEHASESGL